MHSLAKRLQYSLLCLVKCILEFYRADKYLKQAEDDVSLVLVPKTLLTVHQWKFITITFEFHLACFIYINHVVHHNICKNFTINSIIISTSGIMTVRITIMQGHFSYCSSRILYTVCLHWACIDDQGGGVHPTCWVVSQARPSHSAAFNSFRSLDLEELFLGLGIYIEAGKKSEQAV